MANRPPLLRSRIATLALIALCGALGFAAYNGVARYRAADAEVRRVEEQIVRTEAERGKLEAQRDRMRTPAWLALLARQRLNWALPGEQVAFVYKAQKSGTISQPNSPVDERPAWQLWLAWLLEKRD